MHLKTIKGAVQCAKIIEAYSINPKKLKSSFDQIWDFLLLLRSRIRGG